MTVVVLCCQWRAIFGEETSMTTLADLNSASCLPPSMDICVPPAWIVISQSVRVPPLDIPESFGST